MIFGALTRKSVVKISLLYAWKRYVCLNVFDVWMSVYVFYSKKVMKNDYLILEWETRWNVHAILEPRHWHKASIEYKPSIHIRWHSHKPVAVFSYKIFRCKTRDRVQGFSPWIWLEVKRCQGPDESSLMKRDFTCRGLAATLLCSFHCGGSGKFWQFPNIPCGRCHVYREGRCL